MKILEIVCGIMQKDHRYLIGKRKSKVHDGIWEFPGGKVEANESLEHAIIREFKEELNIDVKVKTYLTTVIDQRDDYCLNVHAFILEYFQGNIQGNDHSEYRFVTIDELYTYQFEPSDYAIFDALKQYTVD